MLQMVPYTLNRILYLIPNAQSDIAQYRLIHAFLNRVFYCFAYNLYKIN